MPIHRRNLLKLAGAAALGACSSSNHPNGGSGGAGSTTDATASGTGGAGGAGPENGETFEYIVVGSGAGGGPLAANLARNGHTVLLVEAGEDHGDKLDYQVPAFHAQSTEDPIMRWNYFVKHYDDAARRQADSKYTAREDGVLYPRAGTLGGCTAHNAMITVYPHDSDWDLIATVTGDTSWSSSNMRKYFVMLERCEYLDASTHPTGHGFVGWLSTNRASTSLVVGDGKLEGTLLSAAYELNGFTGTIGTLLDIIETDLNEDSAERDQTEAMFSIPLATDGQKRIGPREYLLQTVAQNHPLTIRTGALATRVILADAPDSAGIKKAVGVEYIASTHQYRADPNASTAPAPATKTAMASREVILSAGAFNTPQLLKLSGIGPRAELDALGIQVEVDLPGVGENLQDRYEVGVVSHYVDAQFGILDGCTFGQGQDPCLATWMTGSGVYTSNGAVVGIVKRSTPDKPVPDLFIFGLPGYFKGYEPGYSQLISADHEHFTWAILKAHTENTAGSVTLRTVDPRDVPEIRFRYFDEGTNDSGQASTDLDAVVKGVQFVRSINTATSNLLFLEDIEEAAPGDDISSTEDIASFVKREAWGHHASCTCKIGGDDDPMAVLDSKFRVRKTSGLRVVDASIFPRIPGFFIVAPIYMISEKATDDIFDSLGEVRMF